MTTDKLLRGQQIAYIPKHVGNVDDPAALEHPDTEFGFVTSGPNNVGGYFCRFWRKDGCGLRTKANSESAPADRVVPYDSQPEWKVQVALDAWC